jgi:asparagine synthase (glutamine-hydrolysing)
MWHATAPVCITYNGEVYNYIELRRELEDRGHSFRSRTDTEVILAAYLEWGPSCVKRFNGMWAFAIFDERAGTVFCSRDRFGVKPFYWVETESFFAFGSEIGQVLPFCARRVAEGPAVRDFLVSGLSDHSAGTFFTGVMSLPPGHNLSYDLARQSIRIQRHYEFRTPELPDVDPLAIAEQFHQLLTDAVRLRLRSDVRVGTCLSGGLDSSAIATIAAALSDGTPEPFRAITGVSEQAENSEEDYARLVVKEAGLHWLTTRPGFADFASAIDDLITTQAEPFGGPSVCMQYFVMRMARKSGIPVLLDGQGGDESLFGYERHYAPWLRDRLRRGGLRGLISGARGAIANNSNVTWVTLGGMLIGSFWPKVIEYSMRPRLRGSRFRSALPQAWREYIERLDDASEVERCDVQKTSLPMLLRYEDRNSMRHSVEARLPFLDYRLMEFSLSIPPCVKMRDGWTKWPLRQAMTGTMPNDIVWRKNKLGFEAPDKAWLGRHQGEMAATVSNSKLLAELFDGRWLKEAYGRLDRRLAWRIYCLAAWERSFGVVDLS